MFLFNRKLSCLGISDAHLYSSYSLNKIILDHSPVFFGLVEAGNSQPGSGLLPRQPVGDAVGMRVLNKLDISEEPLLSPSYALVCRCARTWI